MEDATDNEVAKLVTMRRDEEKLKTTGRLNEIVRKKCELMDGDKGQGRRGEGLVTLGNPEPCRTSQWIWTQQIN